MALTQLTVLDYVLTPLGIRQVGEILKSKKGKIKKKYRWNPDVKSANRRRMSVFKITTKYGYEAHVTHNEEGKTVTFDRVMPTKTNEERFHIQYENGYCLVVPASEEGKRYEGKYYSWLFLLVKKVSVMKENITLILMTQRYSFSVMAQHKTSFDF